MPKILYQNYRFMIVYKFIWQIGTKLVHGKIDGKNLV